MKCMIILMIITAITYSSSQYSCDNQPPSESIPCTTLPGATNYISNENTFCSNMYISKTGTLICPNSMNRCTINAINIFVCGTLNSLHSINELTLSSNTLHMGVNATINGAYTLSMENNSTTISGTLTSRTIRIYAKNDILVASTGKITADGRGYVGRQGPGAGIQAVLSCCGDCACSAGGAGGGHCGNGGNGSYYAYQCGTRAFGGTSYGNTTAPITWGSGGSDSTTGSGGGSIRLISDGVVTVQKGGIISSDGSPVVNPVPICSWVSASEGAGAGGSIWITGSSVIGDGTIRAKGGDNYLYSEGAAGGGGCIRIEILSTNGYTSRFLSINANGGTPSMKLPFFIQILELKFTGSSGSNGSTIIDKYTYPPIPTATISASATNTATISSSATASASSISTPSSTLSSTSTISSVTSSSTTSTATSSPSSTSSSTSTTSSTATSSSSSTTSSTSTATSSPSSTSSSTSTTSSSSTTSSTSTSTSSSSSTSSSTGTSTISASPYPAIQLSFGISNINVSTLVSTSGIEILESILLKTAGSEAAVAVVLQICTIVPRFCPYRIIPGNRRRLLIHKREFLRSLQSQSQLQYVAVLSEILFVTKDSAVTGLSVFSGINSTGWTTTMLTLLRNTDFNQYGSSNLIHISTVSNPSNIYSSADINNNPTEESFLEKLRNNFSFAFIFGFCILLSIILLGTIAYIRLVWKKVNQLNKISPAALEASDTNTFTNTTRESIPIHSTVINNKQLPPVCSTCQHIYLSKDFFCSMCGKSRDSLCVTCHAVVLPTSRYCGNCGQQILSTASEITFVKRIGT